MTVTDRARKLLWGRSGNRCALCQTALSVDATQLDRDSVVGDEAHIVGQSSGGPRAGEIELELIDTYENLILLCRTDHKMVDDQPGTYSSDRLREIKAKHEAWVRETLTGVKTVQADPITRVPRTEAERQRVLLERPPGWEYLLLGAELLRCRSNSEPKFLDYEIGFARPNGTTIDLLSDAGAMTKYMDEVVRLANSLESLMSVEAQERALGVPGELGDPDRIAHLAERWNGIYDAFLDWVAELRGATIASESGRVIHSLIRYAEDPIQSYRAFVDEVVEAFDRVPAAIASKTPIDVNLSWTLRIPDEVTAAFHAELAQLQSHLVD